MKYLVASGCMIATMFMCAVFAEIVGIQNDFAAGTISASVFWKVLEWYKNK